MTSFAVVDTFENKWTMNQLNAHYRKSYEDGVSNWNKVRAVSLPVVFKLFQHMLWVSKAINLLVYYPFSEKNQTGA